MRSTGEVLGMADTFGEAYYKAEEATQVKVPDHGTVLISVSDRDKDELLEVAQGFVDCGFAILATGGTYKMIVDAGLPAKKIKKLYEGRPNISDSLVNQEIDLIVNTPNGDKDSAKDDSYIRKSAIKGRIHYVTTMATAKAVVEAIKTIQTHGDMPVKSLQEFHKEIQ